MNKTPLPVLIPAAVFAPPTVKLYVLPIPVKSSYISSKSIFVV